jgi:hypothetical protein
MLNRVFTKYKAEFNFDASRDDELTVKAGDALNVDLTVKTDEGWLWGECQGRVGVFPAAFAVKLADLESIQEEAHHDFNNTNGFSNSYFPQQQLPQSIPVSNSGNFNSIPQVQTATNQ